MKRNILTLILLLAWQCIACAQHVVMGTVTDGRNPITGANVFIKGTADGCLTDSLGRFSFSTMSADSVQLMVTCIGYEHVQLHWRNGQGPLAVRMRELSTTLGEVVVTGSAFNFGQVNGVKPMGALDVVLDGGSCGDIVAALQNLPGLQKVGEDGKLYVRGGSSEECQTYINGMHVLQPYSTTAPNSASRGRFSPFLFKGISFSLGGYDAEYGQALSSVLPMETTDASATDKLGLSASLIDWNIGGTKATKHGSWSMNATYIDMGIYNHLFPDRLTWHKPYRQLSGETQWKMQPTASSIWKSYLGFDRTTLGLDTEGRSLHLDENNLYFNSVAKGTARGHVTWFAGVAGGVVWQNVAHALLRGDRYRHRLGELHIKVKAAKTILAGVKATMGLESFFRFSRLDYRSHESEHFSCDNRLPALFAMAQFGVFTGCRAETSLRAEYSSLSRSWSVLPRLLFNYRPSRRWLVSLSAGVYTQEPADTIVARSRGVLKPSLARHCIAGLQYSLGSTLVRAEAYYKHYTRLPRLAQGSYAAHGHGMSRGFDLFVDDRSLLPNLTTLVSYSYNDSRRLYLDYTTERQPHYASRHNLRLALKYGVGVFSFGLTESFASGRKSEGKTTPCYNSLDASITCLVSKRVIVYSSLSNLLGRRNVYGYRHGQPVTSGSDRFFYIGIFVSLKSNKAYDIANF